MVWNVVKFSLARKFSNMYFLIPYRSTICLNRVFFTEHFFGLSDSSIGLWSHAHPKETHFLTYLKRIIRSFKEAKSYTGRKRHNMNCVAETKAMSLPSMSCDPQRSKRRRKGWHVWPPELPKGIVNCIFLRWVLTGEICLDRCCLTFLSLKQCCQLF